MSKMSKTMLLVLIIFLSIHCTMAELSCCEEIKEVVDKKKHAMKTLCGSGSRLSANCCKEIEVEVQNNSDAYDALCSGEVLPQHKECFGYKWLTQSDRNKKYITQSSPRCDNLLFPGWYRFGGGAGIKMPTTCVPKKRCGTNASGWMNGAHPTVAEGKVTRKVCYHWHNSCCHWSNNIEVVNCGQYYVYKLSFPPSCNSRYCGSDN